MDQEMTFSLSYEQLTRFAEKTHPGMQSGQPGRDLSLRVSQSRSRADLLA